jgi:threonine dehydrogenase-like Zn-dependent dehydrogenase
MRAVVIQGKRQLSVVETGTPKVDGEKVLIKISDAGICGSDLHAWEHGGMVGLIMGHELAGTVVDSGALKDSLKIGDRVTALPANPCGQCDPCRSGKTHLCVNALAACPGLTAPGAYAEFFASRPDMVRKLPDTISNTEAAMIEPTAVALHALRLAGVRPGDKVLVTGGGIIGLLSASWARIAGASYIALSEVNPLRGANALKMGDVDEVFDARDPDLAKKMVSASGGGFDQVIECSSVAPAFKLAIQTLKACGRLMVVGVSYAPVPIPTMYFLLHELEAKGCFGYTPGEFDMCIALMGKKIIKTERFVSSTVGLDGVQEAFERLTAGDNPDVKIIVRP